MDISAALQNALSGIQAAQSNISLISSNISNAQTPGYSRETETLTPKLENGAGAGVAVSIPQRQINQGLNTTARVQDTAASAASTAETYFQQIQNLFGQVNDGSSLSDTFSTFTGALQTLSTTPDDQVSQQSAVSTAQAVAQQLNSMSSGVQNIRATADGEIATDISTVNHGVAADRQLQHRDHPCQGHRPGHRRAGGSARPGARHGVEADGGVGVRARQRHDGGLHQHRPDAGGQHRSPAQLYPVRRRDRADADVEGDPQRRRYHQRHHHGIDRDAAQSARHSAAEPDRGAQPVRHQPLQLSAGDELDPDRQCGRHRAGRRRQVHGLDQWRPGGHHRGAAGEPDNHRYRQRHQYRGRRRHRHRQRQRQQHRLHRHRRQQSQRHRRRHRRRRNLRPDRRQSSLPSLQRRQRRGAVAAGQRRHHRGQSRRHREPHAARRLGRQSGSDDLAGAVECRECHAELRRRREPRQQLEHAQQLLGADPRADRDRHRRRYATTPRSRPPCSSSSRRAHRT